MSDIEELQRLEEEIKTLLGDTVRKCGIMVTLFLTDENKALTEYWSFGNIDPEQRIALMTEIVVRYRTAQVKACIESKGETIN